MAVVRERGNYSLPFTSWVYRSSQRETQVGRETGRTDAVGHGFDDDSRDGTVGDPLVDALRDGCLVCIERDGVASRSMGRQSQRQRSYRSTVRDEQNLARDVRVGGSRRRREQFVVPKR